MYLWGAGRHGQLAEAGRNVMIPVAAPSFSQAQQVIIKNTHDLMMYCVLIVQFVKTSL